MRGTRSNRARPMPLCRRRGAARALRLQHRRSGQGQRRRQQREGSARRGEQRSFGQAHSSRMDLGAGDPLRLHLRSRPAQSELFSVRGASREHARADAKDRARLRLHAPIHHSPASKTISATATRSAPPRSEATSTAIWPETTRPRRGWAARASAWAGAGGGGERSAGAAAGPPSATLIASASFSSGGSPFVAREQIGTCRLATRPRCRCAP